MKTVKKLLLLLIIQFALISCGSSVTTVKAPSADLSNYDTYAFLPNSMESLNPQVNFKCTKFLQTTSFKFIFR